jgi:hypothetical protein
VANVVSAMERVITIGNVLIKVRKQRVTTKMQAVLLVVVVDEAVLLMVVVMVVVGEVVLLMVVVVVSEAVLLMVVQMVIIMVNMYIYTCFVFNLNGRVCSTYSLLMYPRRLSMS